MSEPDRSRPRKLGHSREPKHPREPDWVEAVVDRLLSEFSPAVSWDEIALVVRGAWSDLAGEAGVSSAGGVGGRGNVDTAAELLERAARARLLDMSHDRSGVGRGTGQEPGAQ